MRQLSVQAAELAAMRLTGDGLAAARGGRVVFEGVSFALAAGEMLSVVGPNGAGKSTLLRLVAGLLPPTAGRIALEPAPEGGIGTEVHYLGHLDALKPALSVRENLAFWAAVYGGVAEIGAALDAIGLGGLEDLPVGTLSAGQKRRAAIARLLLVARPLWLLDEPNSALDSAGEALLGGLVERHMSGGGIVLAATHRGLPVTPNATLALGARP
jgi:heme exporter protein A